MKWLKRLVRVLISAGVLIFLIERIGWSRVLDQLRSVNPQWLVLALVVFSLGQIVSAKRFVYVVQTLGRRISFALSLRVHYVGLWFNQVLPTSLGGDVVKVVLLRHEYGTARAVRATLMDRLSGYLFIVLAVAAALPLYFLRFAQVWPGYVALATVVVSVVALTAAVTLANSRAFRALLPRRVRPAVLLLLDVPRLLKGKSIVRQLWTSGVVHACGIVTFWMLSLSMGVQVALLDHVLIVPLIFLVALMPFSFAGWGVREAGAMGLYGLVNVPREQALAIAMLFGAMLVVAAIPGGILLLRKLAVDAT